MKQHSTQQQAPHKQQVSWCEALHIGPASWRSLIHIGQGATASTRHLIGAMSAAATLTSTYSRCPACSSQLAIRSRRASRL
jgi:hypothetical protein